MLKIDFENQILAVFDVYFWPFNKSHEKINTIFVISAIIASIWNVFIKFRWHDEKLTIAALLVGIGAILLRTKKEISLKTSNLVLAYDIHHFLAIPEPNIYTVP